MLPQSSFPGLVNLYANDPNAKGLGLEQVTPPPGPTHFDVPGWSDAGGLFNPGTPEFQAGELRELVIFGAQDLDSVSVRQVNVDDQDARHGLRPRAGAG